MALESKSESGVVTQPAVWNDSDDERMAISLAGVSRLRKLRTTESEDVVNGTEYIRRLRTQFLRLHPTPDWANTELRKKRKSRRKSHGSGSEVSSSEGEMDTDDDEDVSVKPLAKLLQGAGDLIKGSEEDASGKRVKLRQEVIDIRRLKDVGGVQPVSAPSTSVFGRYLMTKIFAVIYRLSVVPSSSFASFILWPCINCLVTSHLAQRTHAQQSLDIPSNPENTFIHLSICLSLWKQNLRLWSTTLFPRLGPGIWQDRKDQPDSRSQGRTEVHGKIQTLPLRKIYWFDRLCA